MRILIKCLIALIVCLSLSTLAYFSGVPVEITTVACLLIGAYIGSR